MPTYLEFPDLSELSEGVYPLLTNAGWFPGRSVPITQMVQTLESHHYEVFPCVQAFLRSFGGIDIRYMEVIDRPLGKAAFSRQILFDLLDPDLFVEADTFDEFEAYLGRRLCLIGTTARKHIYLLMDSSGQVYGAVADEFSLFGSTLFRAIDGIVMGTANMLKPLPSDLSKGSS